MEYVYTELYILYVIICTIGMQENIEGMHQYIYTADLRPCIAISKIYKQ